LLCDYTKTGVNWQQGRKSLWGKIYVKPLNESGVLSLSKDRIYLYFIMKENQPESDSSISDLLAYVDQTGVDLYQE